MTSFDNFCNFCSNIRSLWELEKYSLGVLEDKNEDLELLNYSDIAKYAGYLISDDEKIAIEYAQDFWELIIDTEATPEDCFEDY